MAKFFALFLLFVVVLFSTYSNGESSNSDVKNRSSKSNVKHYIVYMGGHSYTNSKSVRKTNHVLLASVVGSLSLAKNTTVYHCTKSFRGFSAKLTPKQAHKLSKKKSVISVTEDESVHGATSRSWEFMESGIFTKNGTTAPVSFNKRTFTNLNVSTKTANNVYQDSYGQHIFEPKSYDVIIGIIDGEIWPEALSFSDLGLDPVPDKFRGECQFNHCNRKIIGARYYYKGHEIQYCPLESDGRLFYRSPRDAEGHGTHAASIATGAMIESFVEGFGDHTMHGGALGARIFVYKACWWNLCTCSDIVSAFDDAINDNVDIISMSLGLQSVSSFYDDCFAGSTLEAFKRGIFISGAAGNDGGVVKVFNGWPWITIVAASTIDRVSLSRVILGNSVTLEGYGVNQNDMQNYFQIIYGYENGICKPSGVDSSNWINGRIVIYDWGDTFETKENMNIVNS